MHAAESEPRHRAEHHRGRAHDPRHEHDAARHPQGDAHQGESAGDAAPALSVREVTLEYPDGTANDGTPVSYTHLTLPTIAAECRSRWSPYH